MLRRYQTLVDPYAGYDVKTPSADVWRFILENLRPFRVPIAASLALAVVGAAIEVWLIGYAGRLVDMLAAS
jgi:hypothetical protein